MGAYTNVNEIHLKGHAKIKETDQWPVSFENVER
jgi:hypothetical protein